MAGFVECLDNEDAEELINPDEGMEKISVIRFAPLSFLQNEIKEIKSGFKSKENSFLMLFSVILDI